MSTPGGKDGRLDEFSLIKHLFASLAGPGAFGLTDDAALLQPTPGFDLVLTKDAIAEGRHYLPDDPPGDVARKLLRVNLSDLAAKGAHPRGYLLACAWSEATPLAWMEAFAAGLAEDQERYGISLLGGDTIRIEGPSVFSLTALGEVPTGRMVRRKGARAGDQLYITGTVGDAALGLLAATGKLASTDEQTRSILIERYRVPAPPVTFGMQLSQVASAAIDVSDGLLADLQHLCEASGLGAVIERDAIPLSEGASELVAANPDLWQSVLSGGDDYQILFSAPANASSKIKSISEKTDVRITPLGEMVAAPGVSVRSSTGELIAVDQTGFSHF
ncbi:MAG: thiamine-phosphate kinase [Rhodobiaceae bacterium]|nr:MAG: thiamine-phosphate kinase [Rhodobiaceae bacterium]